MLFQKISRTSVVFVFIVFLSGCMAAGGSTAARSSECRWNPDRCMYEGAYEPGEREYAEQEAKDLNRESARKLRRRSIWW